MYLHIGGEHVVHSKEIIAIIDAKHHKLSTMHDNIIVIDDKEFKSYVITDTKTYLSSISSTTLRKRLELEFSPAPKTMI